LSSNIKDPPSTKIKFRIGVEISSKIFYPAGITTESPSLGGLSPPQVNGELHKSIYKYFKLVAAI